MDSLHSLIGNAQPVLWENAQRLSNHEIASGLSLGLADMHSAQDRFLRFAPLLANLFPELVSTAGQIESDLLPAPHMQAAIDFPVECGRLWIKADHTLPVAGSIKARGGFHEVLEFAENLAMKSGLIQASEDYRALNSPEVRNLFSNYEVAVGSTGNLGLSIGVMAAALGFKAVVHMSADAKEWKKERLRKRGVQVIEHVGDYEKAVSAGRAMAAQNPNAYFVDDERSLSLFLGYAASAIHFKEQLREYGLVVDAEHPLIVYIPCGVGGAPSGIAWGLNQIFGRNVYCYFAEPTQSPCFLVQMLAGDGEHPSVYDFGLHNRTEADGLAVPRASLLAAQAMRNIVAGVYTVDDQTMFDDLARLHRSEGLDIEPSAAAGFAGPLWLKGGPLCIPGANHIVWTTGGSLVPESEFNSFLQRASIG
ncbi:D-serine ammonia-lyase [Polynucleobacter sp. 71A-WALBACH]|uniref:D-serine ammonia-lyase n=1 Tax=Polynucleobacter sp. 71A-WALBACH TaxID=2689097 RepID=UPI001C0E524C|nr:D-serine ammonia-lyase [Polynucleobacter sp. 71A-WALBACH]MBU3594547.1 D-serine ammonia-lyase [Polynucleobacter sp. 71A-WALBACH]